MIITQPAVCDGLPLYYSITVPWLWSLEGVCVYAASCREKKSVTARRIESDDSVARIQ